MRQQSRYMYVCMYVIYIYIYIYIYTHTHTNIHTHIHIHVNIQMHGYVYTHVHVNINTYQDSKAEVVEEHNFWRSSLPRGTCPVRTCSVYYTSFGFLQAVAGTCACEQMYAVLMCVYIHTYKCMHTYRCMACQHAYTIHMHTCSNSHAWFITHLSGSFRTGDVSLSRVPAHCVPNGVPAYTQTRQAGHTNGSEPCV